MIAFGTPSFVDPYANAGGNPFPTPVQFPSSYVFPTAGTYTFQPLTSREVQPQRAELK